MVGTLRPYLPKAHPFHTFYQATNPNGQALCHCTIYGDLCVILSYLFVLSDIQSWHEANSKTQIVSEISGNIFKELQIIKNIWLQKSNIYLQTHSSAKPINQNEDMMQENNKRLLHLIIIKQWGDIICTQSTSVFGFTKCFPSFQQLQNNP